jgi:arylsulfatase A-like enzyme
VAHVPLIVRQPRAADGGLRVGALTQPVDLAATLQEMLGVTMPPADGQSWLPLLRGQAITVREQAVSTWTLADAEEWAVRTLKNTLLVPAKQPPQLPPRAVQLYLKPEDRWEVNNVVQHHMELAEELERMLRGHCKVKP